MLGAEFNIRRTELALLCRSVNSVDPGTPAARGTHFWRSEQTWQFVHARDCAFYRSKRGLELNNPMFTDFADNVA